MRFSPQCPKCHGTGVGITYIDGQKTVQIPCLCGVPIEQKPYVPHLPPVPPRKRRLDEAT